MKLFQLALFFVLCGCSGLFYYPDSYFYLDPQKANIEYESIDFTSRDGVKLSAWHLKSSSVRPEAVIVFFHGNAQNMSSHWMSLGWLVEKKMDILIFDYRGYGRSQGTPGQEGLNHDAVAAIKKGRELQKQRGAKRLVVYGQSLGGVVAQRGLEEIDQVDHPQLLVLDSTFGDYQELAADKLKMNWATYLFSPLAYILVSNQFGPHEIYKNFKSSLLVIHGDDDSVVPIKFGEKIYSQFELAKKHFLKYQGGHTQAYHGKLESLRAALVSQIMGL